MGLMIGMRVPLLPLTAEVFAGREEQTLRGDVQLISYDTQTNLGGGIILTENRGRGPVYIHPTLFKIVQHINDWLPGVEIRLENEKLVMQITSPKSKQIFSAPPVTMTTQPFEVVYDFLTKVQQSRSVYCRKAKSFCMRGPFDPNHLVLIKDEHLGSALMFRQCFEMVEKINPHFYNHPLSPEEEWIFHEKNLPQPLLKGWEIPPGTPVPLVSGSSCNLDIIREFFSQLYGEKNYHKSCPTCGQVITEEYQKWVEVGIGYGSPTILCRECFERVESEHPDFYSQIDEIDEFDVRKRSLPIPYIKGWEISPTAPVPLWNIPPVEVIEL